MVNMPEQSDDLSRDGEPAQTTKGANLKIPVPTKEFDGLLQKAATKRDRSPEPETKQKSSRSGRGRR
jgi:hypothetical protein